MQRKRNIKLLISLVILLTMIVSFVIVDTNKSAIVDKEQFKKVDFTGISKVLLKGDEQEIQLTFDGTRWKVNEKLADVNMIDVLFATLQQAEPKRLVSESLRDSLSEVIEDNGIFVRLFSNDKMEDEFFVLGVKNDTYFKRPGEDIPHLMTIPGYRVYVAGIFELTESQWRDKYVFNFNWRNFQSMKIEYPSEQDQNFLIEMGDQKYFTITQMEKVDTTRLNDFLDATSLLTVEQYVDKQNPSYQDLENQSPFMRIIVRDVANKEYLFELFESSNGDRQYIGLIQGTQEAIVDTQSLKRIIRRRSFFAPE